MRRILIISAVAAVAGIAGLALVEQARPVTAAETIATAQEQTVIFAIENMTCATCPITVRTAMRRVDGVRSVEIDFEAKTATVTFDPSVTMPEQIALASENAGYPAQVTHG